MIFGLGTVGVFGFLRSLPY
ncbi:hypothetical protein ACI2OX_09685 [Bacillus sp. N9]